MDRQIKHNLKREVVIFSIVGIFCAGMAGCDKLNLSPAKKIEEKAGIPEVAVKGPVIAKVNNIPITLEDLNQEIEVYNNSMVAQGKPDQKITTREQKIGYLKNEMVHRYLLYQNALDKGLDRDDDVVRTLQKTKIELLVVALINQEMEKTDVSFNEIQDYYNAYKDQDPLIKEPEQRQVREVVVPTEQEAKDILAQYYSQGTDFATLAKEHSKAANAQNGGDMGFVQEGKNPELDSAVFAANLDVGGISSIFKTSQGYTIVKIEAKRGGKQKPLSEVQDAVKKELLYLKQQQKINDLIGKLSREAKLEFYEGEIK